MAMLFLVSVSLLIMMSPKGHSIFCVVLAYASLKPAKLKEHLTSILPKNALSSDNFFVRRTLDSRHVELYRSSDSLQGRSHALKRLIKWHTALLIKRWHVRVERH